MFSIVVLKNIFTKLPVSLAFLPAYLEVRELGLVSIFWDVNFGTVARVFDAGGELLDQAYIGRTDKFLNELIWMAKVLRHGRENISLE